MGSAPATTTAAAAAFAGAEFAGAKWRLLGAKAAGKIRSCVREKASTQAARAVIADSDVVAAD